MTALEWRWSDEQRAVYMVEMDWVEMAWDDLEAEESFRRYNEALAVGAEIPTTDAF